MNKLIVSFIERIEYFIWNSLTPLGVRCNDVLPLINVDNVRENVQNNDSGKQSDYGILWAVPAFRRSIERRRKRKYGDMKYVYKLFRPITNLKTCHYCGSTHEMGRLCPNCYQRVINETKEMQDKIQAELKLDPVDKEVVVLYNDEKPESLRPEDVEFWKGKRIVEMQKPRPAWFAKNLLEKTTEKPSESVVIEPSQLA